MQIIGWQILQEFIPEFHEQNPISQLGLIITHNKVAKKYTDLSNNPHKHLEVGTSTLYRIRHRPQRP